MQLAKKPAGSLPRKQVDLWNFPPVRKCAPASSVGGPHEPGVLHRCLYRSTSCVSFIFLRGVLGAQVRKAGGCWEAWYRRIKLYGAALGTMIRRLA